MESNNIMKLFEEKELVKICAPMVRYSKLQFRTLVRDYSCDLCYTPMILADSFCQSGKARNNEFTSNLEAGTYIASGRIMTVDRKKIQGNKSQKNTGDSPVVVQFAANTVHDFVGASYMVSPYCQGVDLNCGCPQRWAKQMGIGCVMLQQPELISDLVAQCYNRITKPFTVSVKLRIFKDIRKTVEICKRLEKSGVSYLSIHGRTPSQQTGDIDLEALKLIVENVNCPVIGNGGIKNLSDCWKLQEETKCNGVMVANGLLTNPTLFTGSDIVTEECVQKWINICYNSTLTNSYQAIESDNNLKPTILERPFNLTFQCFHHHLVFMLEKVLPRSKRRIFNNLQNFNDVLLFLNENFGIVPQLYDVNAFHNNKILNLNYDNRNEIYLNLKPTIIDSRACEEYNYENNGKFFKEKVTNDTYNIECDIANIFI